VKKISREKDCIEKLENKKVLKKSTRNLLKINEIDEDVVLQEICENILIKNSNS